MKISNGQFDCNETERLEINRANFSFGVTKCRADVNFLGDVKNVTFPFLTV
jgi:hypothetical protein